MHERISPIEKGIYGWHIGHLKRETFIEFRKNPITSSEYIYMEDFHWSTNPQATEGASVCLVPVFFHPKKPEVGLGHFPYTHMKRADWSNPNLRCDYHEHMEKIERKILKEKGWHLMLFAGAPIPLGLEAYDIRKEKIARDQRIEGFIQMYTELGVKCIDKTIQEPWMCLDSMIVNPKTRAIFVSYRRSHNYDQLLQQR